VVASFTPPFDDHGNSVDNATRIEVAIPTRGELEFECDVDFFCVNLATSGFFLFKTELPSHELLLLSAKKREHGDTTITVYDSDANQIGYNDDGDSGLSSEVHLPIEVTGDYCIKVAGYGGTSRPIYDVVVVQEG